jgi:hypothetical protein
MTNMGAHTNYRKVALAARAPFFKWACANDLLAPDYLKQCVAVLESRPDVVVAFGSSRLFEHDLNASTAYDNGLNLQDDDAFVRFRFCVERLKLNNIVNGVVRLDTLQATSLMPLSNFRRLARLGRPAPGPYLLKRSVHDPRCAAR